VFVLHHFSHTLSVLSVVSPYLQWQHNFLDILHLRHCLSTFWPRLWKPLFLSHLFALFVPFLLLRSNVYVTLPRLALTQTPSRQFRIRHGQPS
jgi:hypothetical protein